MLDKSKIYYAVKRIETAKIDLVFIFLQKESSFLPQKAFIFRAMKTPEVHIID